MSLGNSLPRIATRALHTFAGEGTSVALRATRAAISHAKSTQTIPVNGSKATAHHAPWTSSRRLTMQGGPSQRTPRARPPHAIARHARVHAGTAERQSVERRKCAANEIVEQRALVELQLQHVEWRIAADACRLATWAIRPARVVRRNFDAVPGELLGAAKHLAHAADVLHIGHHHVVAAGLAERAEALRTRRLAPCPRGECRAPLRDVAQTDERGNVRRGFRQRTLDPMQRVLGRPLRSTALR